MKEQIFFVKKKSPSFREDLMGFVSKTNHSLFSDILCYKFEL